MPLLEAVLKKQGADPGAEEAQTLDAKSRLGKILVWDRATRGRGLNLLEEALKRQRELLGEGHADTLFTANALGGGYVFAKDYARAVPLLKDGGRIAYVTCSVLQQENGGQVAAFLHRHRDFAAVPPRELAANGLGERGFMFCQAARLSDEGLLMTPRTTETDGFYVAVMRKG